MDDSLRQYRRLRDRTDRRVEQLLARHGRHITCRPGCCACCTNLTVFPVEYEAILDDLCRTDVREIPFDPAAGCGFLSGDTCVLYAVRPLICRTHGLPVAFLNHDLDPPGHSVSFCPLNFADAAEEDLAFGPDNTLDLDALNEELYEINLQFIHEHPQRECEPTSRIPLSQLPHDLARRRSGGAAPRRGT